MTAVHASQDRIPCRFVASGGWACRVPSSALMWRLETRLTNIVNIKIPQTPGLPTFILLALRSLNSHLTTFLNYTFLLPLLLPNGRLDSPS
jgi:hypothetical protein